MAMPGFPPENKTKPGRSKLCWTSVWSKRILWWKNNRERISPAPLYQKLIRKLKAEDTLVVTSIDRLGRNYSQILDQWRKITKTKEAAVVVLDMPLLDTRRGKDLTGTLIADIVLQLLSYVAQTERENTRKRQQEGIFAAQSRGVHFGPQRMELPENFPALADLWRQGGISSRQAALSLGISYQTFLRRAKEWEPTQ